MSTLTADPPRCRDAAAGRAAGAGPAGARWLARGLAAAGAAMIPWLFVLATQLPASTRAWHWPAAWVGLDGLEALGLLATGLLLARRDDRYRLAAVATATLLVTDAWFDVTTAAPGAQQLTAIAMAACPELPVAALCLALALRRPPVRAGRGGRDGPSPLPRAAAGGEAGGMTRITGEIVIDVPVAVVFDAVADQRNEPFYNPRMARSAKVTAGPIGKGTRFRSAVSSLGRPAEMAIEYTDYQRPVRLASATSMARAEFSGTLTFEPAATGTRLSWTWEARFKGPLRPLTPLLARVGRRQEAQTWAGLKRYLEAQRPATGAAAQ